MYILFLNLEVNIAARTMSDYHYRNWKYRKLLVFADSYLSNLSSDFWYSLPISLEESAIKEEPCYSIWQLYERKSELVLMLPLGDLTSCLPPMEDDDDIRERVSVFCRPSFMESRDTDL